MKKYQFFNGEIAEYSTEEEYNSLVEKNWELIEKKHKEEKKRLENTIEKIKIYIDTILKEKYSIYEIGLVLTKLEENIKKYNSFMIWIDKGYTISHKYINLKDAGINF